jgi:hypothetical protein
VRNRRSCRSAPPSPQGSSARLREPPRHTGSCYLISAPSPTSPGRPPFDHHSESLMTLACEVVMPPPPCVPGGARCIVLPVLLSDRSVATQLPVKWPAVPCQRAQMWLLARPPSAVSNGRGYEGPAASRIRRSCPPAQSSTQVTRRPRPYCTVDLPLPPLPITQALPSASLPLAPARDRKIRRVRGAGRSPPLPPRHRHRHRHRHRPAPQTRSRQRSTSCRRHLRCCRWRGS